MNKPGLTLIDKQVMWSRLIAVVEERAHTLQRTAFSTVVRESGDLAAGVFDADGRVLAQAVTGHARPYQFDGAGRPRDRPLPNPGHAIMGCTYPQRFQRSGKPVSMSLTAAASILRQSQGVFGFPGTKIERMCRGSFAPPHWLSLNLPMAKARGF